MKTLIILMVSISLAAPLVLGGCGNRYEGYEEVNKDKDKTGNGNGASPDGGDETVVEGPKPTIVINGVGYHDWTVYTMGEGKKPAAGYENNLVSASLSDPKTFNPMIANESSSTAAFGGVFEGLTTSDGVTLEVIPSLAESWDISDDGLVYTFHLRKDVKFSDGVPMTADDVLFSFNDVVFNDDIPGIAMQDILRVDDKLPKVEKIDDYTVKITLPSKFAPFARIVGGVQILPKHLLEDAVKDGVFSSTWNVSVDPTEVIGTGPYRITDYKIGQSITQEANPYYWNKPFPRIRKRTILIIKDLNANVLKFKSGETDSYICRGEDYAPLKGNAIEQDFSLYDCGDSSGTFFLTFNQNVLGIPKYKQAWFRDKKFRQAVAHAVDKERIIDEVHRGMGVPLSAAEPASNVLFHNPHVRTYDYDLDEAMELLEAAGYIDYDGDGIREKPKGTPVKFMLTTNAGNTAREQICQILRNDFQAIGLDVSYTPLDFNNLVETMNSAGDWDSLVMGLTGGVEPHFGFNVWRVDGRTHMYNQKPLLESHDGDWKKWKAGLRDWEYEIEKIFEEGVKEMDPAKRRKIYFRWQQVVSEELPYIYLTTTKYIPAVRNKFKNLKPTAYGGVFHNIDTELEIVP